MVFSTDALVLRNTECGDFDRLLTLLTPEYGRINVMAKGVRSQKSQHMALTQPYIYANFEIYRKSDMNWLRGGSINEYFKRMRSDVVKLSLAAYLADVACEATGEFVPAVDILRMTLNSFYGIDRDILAPELIKAVYEWRTAGYTGYMPDLSACGECRSDNAALMYLDVMNGRLLCEKCLRKYATANVGNAENKTFDDTDYERSILIPMGAGAVAASRYALTATPERMFSFRIKDKSDADEFCRAAEVYLLNHFERTFASLDFYKTIIK